MTAPLYTPSGSSGARHRTTPSPWMGRACASLRHLRRRNGCSRGGCQIARRFVTFSPKRSQQQSSSFYAPKASRKDAQPSSQDSWLGTPLSLASGPAKVTFSSNGGGYCLGVVSFHVLTFPCFWTSKLLLGGHPRSFLAKPG